MGGLIWISWTEKAFPCSVALVFRFAGTLLCSVAVFLPFANCAPCSVALVFGLAGTLPCCVAFTLLTHKVVRVRIFILF